ncbi:MAG: T9SS type A sorting domain-containing protein, partial [Bacteroidota bacterium]
TIYVNWSDQRNGLTDTDVWLSKSTDGGMTWSPAIRVNDDPPGKQQFFTWMTIDPITGYLFFVFYDRRNYSDNRTDVYMATSTNGGESFTNIKISESPFNPLSSLFFGDYTNISAYNNMIRPIWTRLDGENLSVYTAIVDSLFTGISKNTDILSPITLDQNYPNPGDEETYISFKIHAPARITLKVTDMLGREITTLINDRQFQPGKYIEHFDITRFNVAPGVYYFSLISGDRSQKRKMVIR